jgi:hypothetical protein
MLVLFSFLLVLVATVLLVLGLLTEDGLAFIYVSIGMSAFAAVVLVIAVRLGKPKVGSAPVPAPVVEPEPVAPEPVDEEWKPALDTPAPRRAVRPLRTPPPVLVEPDLDDDDGELWEEPADQPEWDDELFPIEDYDELSAAEIVAVLGELDAEELALVRERELATRNRRTIVANIDRRLTQA